MTSIIGRRVRGVLVSVLLWSVPWTLFGVACGTALALGATSWHAVAFEPSLPGGLPTALGLVGLITGALYGLLFSLVLAAAERRGSVDTLPAWRFGLWGALATF